MEHGSLTAVAIHLLFLTLDDVLKSQVGIDSYLFCMLEPLVYRRSFGLARSSHIQGLDDNPEHTGRESAR
jgi:hypothetical protein